MSDLFDARPTLVARKTELEAEAVEIQARVIENRARHEEVCAMLEQIERKGRRKPGPQAGTPRPMRVVEPTPALVVTEYGGGPAMTRNPGMPEDGAA